MKLIIYLLSHDPDAKSNHRRLLKSREKEDFEKQQIDIVAGHVQLAKGEEVNIFDAINSNQRNNITIELIAHGLGDGRLRGFSSTDAWNAGASNNLQDITPDKLKDFFMNYAYAEEKYKFTNLTLFCCASYDFGKELARIMPEIKITCFKEYIRIENGQAYPYALDARRKAVPIDENGNFIQALQYDAKDKLMNYFPAPLRVFEGNSEVAIYACSNALPDNLKIANMNDDPRPIIIRTNPIATHEPLIQASRLSQGEINQPQNISGLDVQSSSSSSTETTPEDEKSSFRFSPR